MIKTNKNLIKTIFVLVTVLITSVSSFSQDKDDKDGPKRNYGFGAGVNFTSIHEGNTGGISTFYGSFIMNQRLVPFFKLQTGLTYLRNGATIDADNDAELTLDYLQVPVLLRIKIGPIFLLTGFTGAVKIGQNYTGDFDIKKGDIKGFDFTSQLGGGFKLANFTIEGRYNWGKTNIYQGEGATVDYHSRYFQLGVTMMLL
jgi:hypothetical protein